MSEQIIDCTLYPPKFGELPDSFRNPRLIIDGDDVDGVERWAIFSYESYGWDALERIEAHWNASPKQFRMLVPVSDWYEPDDLVQWLHDQRQDEFSEH